ncbi:hypothetical protein BD324DRAFT_634849 [Kockovaella imperatae]|uniref:TPR-like protein n=1 Tax=Kockovaella imperatae TaxID=4999 RepID=A0A1Y1UB77_9TREE|nr:hypothetical protein BD324DRAFT_634849 [Kockovaella imperatae]ORX34756.1 hypothetical protein BD324DRAFT_634849 [Kockovaella imperatae]
MTNDKDQFESLGNIKAEAFKVPSWATGPGFPSSDEKLGESSKSRHRPATPEAPEDAQHGNPSDVSEDEEEVWEDAEESVAMEGVTTRLFSNGELEALISKAVDFKTKGNTCFQAKPPDLDNAISYYKQALDCLPAVDKSSDLTTSRTPLPTSSGSGIQEITDEEAEAIQESEKTTPEAEQRKALEIELKDCTKACWGNLGACYIAKNDDKEAVAACTAALEVDSLYVKALQRRAAANERIASWSSLSSAQTDYEMLIKIVGTQSSQASLYRQKVAGLGDRIKVQQEKEKDEMLSKLKDLGNSLLGNFGLSTDNFKFDQQEGGGYSMRFER